MKEDDGRIKDQIRIKEETPVEEMCKDLPKCFEKYLTSVKKLGFEEKPPYKMLKALFDDTYNEMGYP